MSCAAKQQNSRLLFSEFCSAPPLWVDRFFVQQNSKTRVCCFRSSAARPHRGSTASSCSKTAKLAFAVFGVLQRAPIVGRPLPDQEVPV